jgi:hypothetical protein
LSTKGANAPTPWSVEQQEACFVVKVHDGQQLAYVYFEDEPGRWRIKTILCLNKARPIVVGHESCWVAPYPDVCAQTLYFDLCTNRDAWQ